MRKTPGTTDERDAIRLSNEFKPRYMVMRNDVKTDDLLNITSLGSCADGIDNRSLTWQVSQRFTAIC